MAKELVTDELWETIEPLLPPEPRKPKGGRPRIDDRAALSGIVFVLKSGIRWEMVPRRWAADRPLRVGGVYAPGKKRGMGKAAPGAAEPPRRSRSHRLGASFLGHGERAGQRGTRNRA